LQLLAALATLQGNDSEVISGTGTDKTLAMAIPHLLHPERVSLIASPLKYLEVTQVYIFPRDRAQRHHQEIDDRLTYN
jgi:superfamily II DNA/RNA helicase